MLLLTVLPLSVLVCHVLAQGDGDIRLVSNSATGDSHGRLEFYWSGVWGTVCDDGFTFTEAQVVCQQLGYTDYISYGTATELGYTSGTGEILLDDVSCSSSTYIHILQCSNGGIYYDNCAHSEDVAVVCSTTRLEDNPYTGQIRLVGGSYPSRGRVEVYCSGEWGTVCDDSFGINDALTVCRQLGYNDYDAYDTGTFASGSSSQPIWLDDLPCSSSDVCILECESCPSGHNCFHSEDVDIYCSYDVNSYYTTATLTTCEYLGTSDAGAIAGIIIGVVAGVVILSVAVLIAVYLYYMKSSKKRTPRQPITQNVQTTANTSSAQVPPSSYPQQPPAPNPQLAYPAQYPAAYPVQAQAGYPGQVAYPGQVPYPAQAPYPVQGQAPYMYPNQPQGGAYPMQPQGGAYPNQPQGGAVPPPVTTSGGNTAPYPPSSTAALPPSNSELHEQPPPSYVEVQKESNTPYP